MSKLSESAQVEMMKLAASITQQYFTSFSAAGTLDRTTLLRIGIKVKPEDACLTDVIDHIYSHLCEQIKP